MFLNLKSWWRGLARSADGSLRRELLQPECPETEKDLIDAGIMSKLHKRGDTESFSLLFIHSIKQTNPCNL